MFIFAPETFIPDVYGTKTGTRKWSRFLQRVSWVLVSTVLYSLCSHPFPALMDTRKRAAHNTDAQRQSTQPSLWYSDHGTSLEVIIHYLFNFPNFMHVCNSRVYLLLPVFFRGKKNSRGGRQSEKYMSVRKHFRNVVILYVLSTGTILVANKGYYYYSPNTPRDKSWDIIFLVLHNILTNWNDISMSHFSKFTIKWSLKLQSHHLDVSLRYFLKR